MTENLAQFILEQINNREPKYNCYFYTETQDMNARTPDCNYYDSFGCPCREGKSCDKFIDRTEVRQMVKDFVDNR